MNKFNNIRLLDKKLEYIFSSIDAISKEDPSESIAFTNLIKGFKTVYTNIKLDLVDPYYETQNPKIEDKIIERLEKLIKVIEIILDFENN
jgi:hypothetical protein